MEKDYLIIFSSDRTEWSDGNCIVRFFGVFRSKRNNPSGIAKKASTICFCRLYEASVY